MKIIKESCDIMKKITTGSILKELRLNNAYSVEDLAQYFNNNSDLITSWENDASEPTISECKVLSGLYGIPVDDMFFDIDVRKIIPDNMYEKFTYERRLNRLASRCF